MRLTASASCELMALVCVSTGSGTFNALNCMLGETALFIIHTKAQWKCCKHEAKLVTAENDLDFFLCSSLHWKLFTKKTPRMSLEKSRHVNINVNPIILPFIWVEDRFREEGERLKLLLHDRILPDRVYLLFKLVDHPRIGHCAPVVAPINCCGGLRQGGQSAIKRNHVRRQ